MSMTFNMVGGGGGGLNPNKPLIHVNAPLGSTVDFTLSGVIVATIPPSKAIPNVDGETAEYYYSCPSTGTYTVTATLSGQTASCTVSVVSIAEYDITVGFYSALKAEILASGVLLISDKTGDIFHRVYNSDIRTFTRTSNEKILLINGYQSSYWGYGAISFSSSLAGTATTYGNLTQYGAFTTPNGISYYTFFQRTGFNASQGSLYYTLDGTDYSTLQMSTSYPYINTSGVLSCTDSSKLDQVYAYIDKLHEYI